MTAGYGGHSTGSCPTSTGAFRRRRALGSRVLILASLIAVGALSGFQVLGYTLTAFTMMCLFAVPAVLLQRMSPGERLTTTIALTGVGAFVLSAQINGTTWFDQRVVQWGSFCVYFLGILVLSSGKLDRILTLAAGVSLGSCIYFTTAGLPALGAPGLESFWKYAYAPWITLLGLYVLVMLRVSTWVQALSLILLAGCSLVLNYRSHALVCVVGAAIVLVTHYSSERVPRWLQLALVGFVALACAKAIPAIAKSGLAGQAVKEKTELQSSEGVPTILAGRTESPLSISAILERPVFGWGSANSITDEVFARAETLAVRLGFDPALDLAVTWHLPNGDTSLHSTLFNAWAEGGVFAAALPIGLLCMAVLIIWNSSRYGRWSAMVVIMAVQALWDLLFSPTSYNILTIYAVVAAVFTARHLTREKKSEYPPPSLTRRVRDRESL